MDYVVINAHKRTLPSQYDFDGLPHFFHLHGAGEEKIEKRGSSQNADEINDIP
jgi:hypothetical protein